MMITDHKNVYSFLDDDGKSVNELLKLILESRVENGQKKSKVFCRTPQHETHVGNK